MNRMANLIPHLRLTTFLALGALLFSAGARTRNRDPSAVTSKSSMPSTWKSGTGSPAANLAPGDTGTAMTSPAGPM